MSHLRPAQRPRQRAVGQCPRRASHGIALCAAAIAALFALPTHAEILRVGTSGDYPPFSHAISETEYEGFDIDVARRFAADHGYEIEFVRFRWSRLEAQLAAGRFDIAMSGITLRPQRSLVGSYSHPVIESGVVALVTEDSPIGDIAHLGRPGLRIGVNAGGHLESVARAQFPNAVLIAIDDNSAIAPALLELGIDAAITDTLEAPVWQQQVPGARTFGPFSRDRKAYLVHPDRRDLARQLDRWLIARELDGSLSRIRREHFGAELKGPTALPIDALAAAIDERLALMPWVLASKRANAQPILMPSQERRVRETMLAAVRRAETAAGRIPWPEAELLQTIEMQIQVARRVQSLAGRDEDFEPEKIYDLDTELRPAIARISDRIAETLAVLPPDSAEWRVRSAINGGLRSPWVEDAMKRDIAESLLRLLAAARAQAQQPPSDALAPGSPAAPGAAPPFVQTPVGSAAPPYTLSPVGSAEPAFTRTPVGSAELRFLQTPAGSAAPPFTRTEAGTAGTQ